MKVIVLAGGEGKRMWPIVTEKCLIPFLGKPLIYYTLSKLKDSINFDEIIIVAKSSSQEEISNIALSLGLKFKIAIQNNSKGMADAIISAKHFIKDEILIVNAEDVLEEKIYQDVVTLASESTSDVVLPGLKVDKYFPGGYLKIEGEKVTEIVEKPGEGNEPSDMVKLVVDYFKDGQTLVNLLENVQTENDDVYEVALSKLIEDGADVKFSKYDGVWIPLKYPWHILDITGYFLGSIEQQISPEAKVSDKADISGKVVIEEGAKIFEGAVIKGSCYIGKNVIVGNNSMVRESNLEAGCVTGFNSDITRSYIGANSWFHTNYIGDSVLEGDFGMGSGAVLANLRLDDHTIRIAPPAGGEKLDTGRTKLGTIAGKGSRVGVNASIMPGVRVGANSLVGPGVTLYKDVEDNKKVLVKQEHEITEHTPVLTSYEKFRDKI